MNNDIPRMLTPDGVAYAQFLRDASAPTGLAVSESVMTAVEFADDEVINAHEYENADVGGNMMTLAGLWPVVQALSPAVATELALRHPHLWGNDAE